MPSNGGLPKHDHAFLVGFEPLVVFLKVSWLEPSDVGPDVVDDRIDAVAVARLGTREDDFAESSLTHAHTAAGGQSHLSDFA